MRDIVWGAVVCTEAQRDIMQGEVERQHKVALIHAAVAPPGEGAFGGSAVHGVGCGPKAPTVRCGWGGVSGG